MESGCGENGERLDPCLPDGRRRLFTADHSTTVAMRVESATRSNPPQRRPNDLYLHRNISSPVNYRGCVSTPTLCCIVGNTRADACGLAICEGQWVRVTAALLDPQHLQHPPPNSPPTNTSTHHSTRPALLISNGLSEPSHPHPHPHCRHHHRCLLPLTH